MCLGPCATCNAGHVDGQEALGPHHAALGDGVEERVRLERDRVCGRLGRQHRQAAADRDTGRRRGGAASQAVGVIAARERHSVAGSGHAQGGGCAAQL
jgi:hypothetical protein